MAHLPPFQWDAGDKSNSGRLDFKLSILLRPDSKSFSALVETPAGTRFGGNLTVTLNNDGTGTFAGAMHDSGFPSYNFSVRAVVRSASGSVTVVAQKSGEVKGTDSGAVSGDDPARTFSWNDPLSWSVPEFAWSDISAGAMAVSKSYELSGVLGTLSDLLFDVVDFVIGLGLVAPFPGGAAVVSLLLEGFDFVEDLRHPSRGPRRTGGCCDGGHRGVSARPDLHHPRFCGRGSRR
jgi:hypothetical protein